ncbi:MAG: polyprenyl synthetase family protein [Clostridia bacterium]|nr:polyprenyl synthetase family protein [Clostridia bacterium]
MASFNDKYNEYLSEFNEVLNGFCNGLDCRPQLLADSLKYSLMLGGKRIRPVLTFAVGDLLGIDRAKLKNFALAIELIHTYSLIHDDLPEMDNDDFRRGKPSNHKVFGTGNAVLAGDGLLNTAYSLLLKECHKGAEYVSAAEFICDCAGVYGMIAGQSADLMHENDKSFNEPTLEFIYENKTAKLLTAPVVVPGILGGGKYYSELKAFGSSLGFLFQITDDILDVEGDFSKLGKSIGKDEKEGKYTSVALYGLDGSKLKADFLAEKCTNIIESIGGDNEFLLQLVSFVRSRRG